MKNLTYKKLIVFCLACMLYSCNKSNKQELLSIIWRDPTVIDTNYVVNRLINPNIDRKVKGFYTINNLILDTTNICYFYQLESRVKSCGYTIEPYKIEFINLKPQQLTAISIEFLDRFLDLNIQKNNRNDILLMVSSPIDTVRQESFRILVNYIRKKKDTHFLHGIRLMTEEEQNVLFCKKQNKIYDKDDFNWKTTCNE